MTEYYVADVVSVLEESIRSTEHVTAGRQPERRMCYGLSTAGDPVLWMETNGDPVLVQDSWMERDEWIALCYDMGDDGGDATTRIEIGRMRIARAWCDMLDACESGGRWQRIVGHNVEPLPQAATADEIEAWIAANIPDAVESRPMGICELTAEGLQEWFGDLADNYRYLVGWYYSTQCSLASVSEILRERPEADNWTRDGVVGPFATEAEALADWTEGHE